MSPTLFREYGNDIPACMTLEYQRWKVGEQEDLADLMSSTSAEVIESPITSTVKQKREDEKSEDEKWDEYLRSTANNIDSWRMEKQVLDLNLSLYHQKL